MTPAYSDKELKILYPKNLKLQLVQVLLRHGERTPVSGRFQNAGLTPYWPYCGAAQRFTSVVKTPKNGETKWGELHWRRRLEIFGSDDEPRIAEGPNGAPDSICNLGELTDRGRDTTYALGQRLRHLYVNQLEFMPNLISDADMFYLRATPIPRALESLQQTFWGMYPSSTRTGDFPITTIVTRTPADETLFPNDSNCRRLNQLSRAFAQRTADRWNESPDMKYLSSLISSYMPGNAPVAVDSHPRLSGIMDTVNSTRAHGPATKLPNKFYDKKAISIIEKISTEEWFSGYRESKEYRLLGSGSLMGDIVSRMMGSIEGKGNDGLSAVGFSGSQGPRGRGRKTGIKFALSGCHDTTLAAAMASVGAYKGEAAVWPPYTSHLALELFKDSHEGQGAETKSPGPTSQPGIGLWDSFGALFGSKPEDGNEPFIRKPTEKLNASEKKSIEGYYVRMRFNDHILTVPGCAAAGKHLDGDVSFCTLAAFKDIVDKFTPRHWKASCLMNLEEPRFPREPEPSGF
ncbi:MAG: hypothetical protein M1814_000416 [Vezdaea aestivalis]|nr:MAG: hypothetical protein M1814_000416 [Vezdaea aestivalis]